MTFFLLSYSQLIPLLKRDFPDRVIAATPQAREKIDLTFQQVSKKR